MATHNKNFVFSFLGVTLTSLFVLMATNVKTGKALSFKFTKFGPDESKLTLQGTAAYLPNKVLALTRHEGDPMLDAALMVNTGRVLYNKSLILWDDNNGKVVSFVTSFCFVVEDISGSPSADGIVFFLSPNTQIPSNSEGGNLGVVGSTSQFVGVEFDSFSNEWDPSFAHIGIDVNSLVSSNTIQWNRVSGSLVQATITYNSQTKILKVALVDENATITTVEQVVDLKAILPAKVNVGISGTTGGAFETHDIHSWSFTSTLESHTKIVTTNIPSYSCNTN